MAHVYMHICILYIDGFSMIHLVMQALLELVIQRFRENEEYLMRLEKLINPLLDDDDLTALTYIFSEIMEKNIKTMQVQRINICDGREPIC